MNISTLAAEGLREGNEEDTSAMYAVLSPSVANQLESFKSAISGVMMVIYDIKPTTNWTDRIIKKRYKI
jgi:hypothetical protein